MSNHGGWATTYQFRAGLLTRMELVCSQTLHNMGIQLATQTQSIILKLHTPTVIKRRRAYLG